MPQRESVAPASLSVDVTDDEVAVGYLDGHIVRYTAPTTPTEPPVRTQPRRLISVLVVAPDETEATLTYVNELNTDAEMLKDTGVGRVLVDPGERASIVPGVEAEGDGHAVVIHVDFSTVDGRVFVFEEDQFAEAGYELVASTA